MIEQPALRVGLELGEGLVETILDDVVERPGALPLLEDVLLEVWQTAGDTDPMVLRGHADTVEGVAFNPDGDRIASAGAGGTVRIWPAAGDGDPVILSGHDGAVYGVAFSPDGQRIASAGSDGTVRIWQCEVCGSIEELLTLADQRVTRELTCEERRAFLYETDPCPS
ncbi:MAG: WD40 repeat domain-containing protein [Egibacteraceae bacterium]